MPLKLCKSGFHILEVSLYSFNIGIIYRTRAYGEKSKEAIQPLFMYGSALLGRALLNDEHLSSMPKEQAMWFEAVTGN